MSEPGDITEDMPYIATYGGVRYVITGPMRAYRLAPNGVRVPVSQDEFLDAVFRDAGLSE